MVETVMRGDIYSYYGRIRAVREPRGYIMWDRDSIHFEPRGVVVRWRAGAMTGRHITLKTAIKRISRDFHVHKTNFRLQGPFFE